MKHVGVVLLVVSNVWQTLKGMRPVRVGGYLYIGALWKSIDRFFSKAESLCSEGQTVQCSYETQRLRAISKLKNTLQE